MFQLLTRQNKDILSTLHPLSIVLFFAVVLTMAMSFTHPLYLIVFLSWAIVGILREKGWEQWKPVLLLCMWITCFIVVINLFVSRNGSTILWEGPRIGFLGRIFFTQEALWFALDMGLKLIATLSLSTYFGLCLSFDRTMNLFYQIIPRAAQVLVLSVVMFPKMARRCKDVYEVMRLRGAPLMSRGLFVRLHAHMPLLKVVLLSGLEDSWQMGEALYVRGYGSQNKRAAYARLYFTRRDIWVGALTFLMVGIFINTISRARGLMTFYPVIEGKIDAFDLMMLGLMTLCFFLFVYFDAIWKRWTSLR